MPAPLRGHLGIYNVSSAAEADAHLQHLTTRWTQLTEHTMPTPRMRQHYRADVDALLDARTTLRLAEARS